ncbi:MAG TPA: hypothetical protein P5217_04480 [Methanoregulaceae archaeon]|nr:hypothetical protein [Methanoregulaceae archaeon]HRY75520.1 hypothetical protein [Methanoregulaceae archaeon]
MVDHAAGQLYTIEGIAAALIMIVTVWIVLGTTTMYTPGDTHISDMQLEQLGTDVLAMMDTPNSTLENRNNTSNLQQMIKNNYSAFSNPPGDYRKGPELFNTMFLSYANSMTNGRADHIQYSATVYYRNATTPTGSYEFSKTHDISPGDHAVRVTRWVLIDNTITGPTDYPSVIPAPANNNILDRRWQEVLVEVLIWRG